MPRPNAAAVMPVDDRGGCACSFTFTLDGGRFVGETGPSKRVAVAVTGMWQVPFDTLVPLVVSQTWILLQLTLYIG